MEWVFDGGRLCIDLVNTLRDRHAGGRELVTGPDALTRWLDLAGLSGARAVDGDVSTARTLREVIDRVTRAVSVGRRPAADDVACLNTMAAALPPPALRIDDDGTPRRVTSVSPVPVAAALAVVAADAIDLVTGSPDMRVCAADDCGLRFVDVSPKRNRQWCSMARCGNRAKARAHYARRRS
ncbi:ABATE domain-containing protein [Saccharomonospora sp. NPDC046836]|uniref:CGNR zinc finger domain-containing protein n=1 Tax=Saccharomonospora sp. NPDC046836 TaxID=3156921 RepID=UPI00340187B4